MNSHIIPLHLTDLYERVSSHKIASKRKIAGVKILGDSLSDPGGQNGMYEKKILGCIPLSLFLYKSPYEQFTNGYSWDYAFEKALEFARESANPLENPNLIPIHGFFKSVNRAQGGAMAYNYREKVLNVIKYLKGFLLSFVLTNIENEAKKLKKESKLNSDDLAIIFAGANDLVTVGYCNKGGAERALQGIAKTIDILTNSQQKNGSNYIKNILAFTLPDFSKTPRFSKKTEQEKKQAKEACYAFNKGLKDLAKNYHYFDFNFCDVYQVIKKEYVNLTEIKEKGIIITGLGNTKKVYFVDQGQFILKENKPIAIDIKLSKMEKKLLGYTGGKILKGAKVSELEKLIHKLANKAKLNIDVKIFDAAAVFDKIDENPEVYGFTSGCAVYYLDKNQDKECISRNITSGNAIILKEINQAYNSQNKLPAEFCCFYVKDGKLVEHEINSTRIASITSFTLFQEEYSELEEKIKQRPLVNGITQLIGMEDKHTSWTTCIVQSAIKAYQEKFGEKIQLADIYASVLLAIKKNFPNQQVIFWDDLHPSVMVHFLLETMFEPFFKSNYSIKQPQFWLDDMGIAEKRGSAKVELKPKAAEAPAEWPSSMRMGH